MDNSVYDMSCLVRHTPNSKKVIRVLSSGAESFWPLSLIKQSLGTDLVTRIPNRIYPDLNLPAGTILSHFGLEILPGSEPVGSKLLLARIIQHGQMIKGSEILPLLLLENVWQAEILECTESLPYEQVDQKYFMNALGKFTDIPSLKEEILARYSQSLPDISQDQLLAQPISIRVLRLEKILPKVDLE